MFIEILNTIYKLIKKNIAFLVIFFIVNFFLLKFSLLESSSFELVIFLKLIQNIMLIGLIILLSKSMKYKINYKRSLIYFFAYSIIDLLQIFFPSILTIVLILKMFLVFFPYLYFVENLNVNDSIKYSMNLFRELYVNILLLFINYYTIFTLFIYFYIRNDIVKIEDINITVLEMVNKLGNKLPYILTTDTMLKTIMIAAIYFAFKIKTERKENEE
ncbi:hypothetical protein HP397_00100 [Streptobacillus felis]|uniref:Uncharacterized protein n=1 Tax=Streptobacillus felis TaxID=1384509 RepID=A0A7Z0PEU0_9FUSO|nr:hypothetical protein [Streptobacillus felis]NYV27227.1 hypothetical protein [Streptobacillus felis]